MLKAFEYRARCWRQKRPRTKPSRGVAALEGGACFCTSLRSADGCLLPSPIECLARRALVRSEQTRKLSLLQNQPFGEAPWTAASLVFQVDPIRPGTRMPKGFPKHRQIISLGPEPNNMPDTDSIRIAPLKPVSNAECGPPALLTPTNQKPLIPPAWRQLIPDKRGDAA